MSRWISLFVTFYGAWNGNVQDLYSESGQAVIDTNSFNPGSLPLTRIHISPAMSPTTLRLTGMIQFTATPTGGNSSTLVYNWYVNNAPVSTGASFTIAGSQFAVGDSATVYCTCSNNTNSFTSNSVILTII